MGKDNCIVYYEPKEERLNIWTHGIGFLLSLIGFVLLVIRSVALGDMLHLVCFQVFGLSLILLYFASTIYHKSTKPSWRTRLNIFDHVSIFLLVGGSYTPITLITLNGSLGWTMFGFIWSAVAIGVVLKIFFTGKYKILSTLMYVGLGWAIVFVYETITVRLAPVGLLWLLAGGVLYTIGALLYCLPCIKYNHAIFHLFVLFGSVCHFLMFYFYV